MIEITNGVKTIKVPDATAEAVLKLKWLKNLNWTIVPKSEVPKEIIQFQAQKIAEKPDNSPVKDCSHKCDDLSSLSLRKLEEIVNTLTSEQLLSLTADTRKSVKALAEKQLKKLSNDSGT